ncbi:hypothetical protein R3W88_017181 [Solanum pinnatisectum]|uniref:AIPP2-like SPOC-like domain-containing protein n=1 Tax=Solanum pinnatisectum TaxID=50273 RepID=A0AAV9L0R6_9SOLN|nr:hypothetical protein R3W88_017181 [Solanum pinnatisectum]
MATHSPMQKEPNNIHQPNMKKVCEVCGDLDIQEAIITCYQCKNVDVHQYCVVGYWEDAPVNWCCEECDIRKGVMFSPRGIENERFKGSKLPASTRICPSIVQPKKHKALDLSAGIKKYGSPLINIVSSRVVSTKSRKFSKPKGPGASTILEHRSPDAVNESRMMNLPMTHPCDLALVPSWKGNFDILGALELAPGIFNTCIQAHPPCRVRRKVYEFSGLLPDTLKLELIPRGDLWPSLFNNHCSSKKDIGLYFFGSERKRFDGYITLVEFMRSKDLVMRTLINDVELLILHPHSCAMILKHFLWGLFYRMKKDTDRCAEGGCNKVK